MRKQFLIAALIGLVVACNVHNPQPEGPVSPTVIPPASPSPTSTPSPEPTPALFDYTGLKKLVKFSSNGKKLQVNFTNPYAENLGPMILVIFNEAQNPQFFLGASEPVAVGPKDPVHLEIEIGCGLSIQGDLIFASEVNDATRNNRFNGNFIAATHIRSDACAVPTPRPTPTPTPTPKPTPTPCPGFSAEHVGSLQPICKGRWKFKVTAAGDFEVRNPEGFAVAVYYDKQAGFSDTFTTAATPLSVYRRDIQSTGSLTYQAGSQTNGSTVDCYCVDR